MDKKLFIKALVRFFLGVVIMGVVIFVPAGSVRYWQGWLLMGILFVPMFAAGLVMLWKNPELLRKRLNAREKESEQKTVVALSGLLFLVAFVVAGLYGIVRHPMYMATTVLFLSMPLVLASPISFLIMLGYLPVIDKRIRNEETVLEEGLEGYSNYKKRVRYKIIPFIW